jgi:hypothetical protein
VPNPSLRTLSIALRIVGVIFLVGATALTRLWPSGWIWHPENPAYLQMILGIYATLGVFLLYAASDPARHLSLIWFTVWSSVVHGLVMAIHAFTDPGEMGHLPGDVAGLLIIGAGLAVLVLRTDLRLGAVGATASPLSPTP